MDDTTTTTSARIVNRVPASAAKRRQNDGSNGSSEPRRHPSKHQKQEEPSFPPLDPAVHAKRIEQRRKAIMKGKNTAGYDAYIQQVPKNKRRPRSMETPSTPNPTLDIPKKRWDGMVKAW